MKFPSLDSLRWQSPARGTSTIGQFRRWAFTAVLLAAAVVRVWTAGERPAEDREVTVQPPDDAVFAASTAQPTITSAANQQFSPVSFQTTASSSGIRQANFWQTAASRPVIRPAIPVPASYPDAATAPADHTLATAGTAVDAVPFLSAGQPPAATTQPETVPSTGGLPSDHNSQPATATVVRPGHAALLPAGPPVSSEPPIHVFPNRMGVAQLESSVDGEPPVHVFPEARSWRPEPASSENGRPTSVFPPHVQPRQTVHQKHTPAGPGRFDLTSQPRPLDPANNALILPPAETNTQSPIPPPYGRSFSRAAPTPQTTEVFAPPAYSSPSSAATLPINPSAAPRLSDGSAMLPGHTYDLPVNPQPAEVVVPGETADLLSWWERDITRPVFRQRRPVNLTLEQALGLSISEAPELQVLHSDWFIRQVEIARQDAAFDWTSFVDGIWNRDSVPVSSSLDGATNRLRSRTSSGQAGLRKLLRDGGELEFSQVVGTENSNSQFISPNNQGTSRLQVEWTHRLLRGGGEAYNSSRVRIAAIENDSAFDLFQEGVQDHLLNVSSAYWILVLRRGRFVQSVTSWNRARTVADEMGRRAEVDVTPAMLDRARSEVADRLASCIEAQHDVYRAQDALLRLIYGPEFVQYASSEVVTQTLPMKHAPPVAAEPQIEQAIRNRSEVHRSIRNIKIAAVQYEVAEDEVLPVLDMTLTGYAAGLRGNNDIGGSIANQFTEGEPGVGIGFNFEMPYRNRAALAAAEQARVAIKRMQAELETTIANVSEDVRDQVTQRNKYGKVLRQQWESLARSRRLLKTTQTRRRYLADGTRVADLYLENLLQMQERLEQAESTYLQSQIRFAVADNALLRAVSMLDTLAEPVSTGYGPGAAVREAAGRKSSSHINVAQDPHLSGYDPENLDAVYEPPQPPIAR